MVAINDKISKNEHLLAEKAQSILEHQQELEALKKQKEKLQVEKPTTEKDQLTYEESLGFSKQVQQYEKKLQRLESQIQKTTRELNALKLQAKKLIPVSEVKIRVSTEDSPQKTFFIELQKSVDDSDSENRFKVEQIKH